MPVGPRAVEHGVTDFGTRGAAAVASTGLFVGLFHECAAELGKNQYKENDPASGMPLSDMPIRRHAFIRYARRAYARRGPRAVVPWRWSAPLPRRGNRRRVRPVRAFR